MPKKQSMNMIKLHVLGLMPTIKAIVAINIACKKLLSFSRISSPSFGLIPHPGRSFAGRAPHFSCFIHTKKFRTMPGIITPLASEFRHPGLFHIWIFFA